MGVSHAPLQRRLSFLSVTACTALLLWACTPVGTAATAEGERSAEKTAPEKTHVEEWLLLGPLPSPLPAYADEDTKPDAGDLLGYKHISLKEILPAGGGKVSVPGGDYISWSIAAADTGGVEMPSGATTPQIAYLAAYVEVPRWMKLDLEARGTQAFELTMDGASAIKQTGTAKMSDDPKKGDVKLEKGKHLILVKTVLMPPGKKEEDGADSEPRAGSAGRDNGASQAGAGPGADAGAAGRGESGRNAGSGSGRASHPAERSLEWRFDFTLSAAEGFEEEPALSIDPTRTMNTGDVLDAPTITRVDLSPDGSNYAVWISERRPPEGESDRRVEIRRFRDSKLLHSFKDVASMGQWGWAPDGNRIAYVAVGNVGGSLRVLDLDTGEIDTVFEDVEDIGGFRWSPDGTYIAYSVIEKYDPGDAGVKRLRGPYDRRHYERDKSLLYLSSVPGGTTREMTAGERTTYIYDIHPDAERMLVGRTYEDLSQRPYEVTEISILHVVDQTTEDLLKGPWLDGALWSPDGEKVLVLGGPSAFGSVGVNVPEGVIPNEYDTQAYIYDPKTKDADPITRDFDPTIEAAYWPKPGNYIYFVVEQTEYRELYKYNVRRRTFRKIDLPCDVIHSADVARDRAVAMCRGSSADEPIRLYAVDLVGGRVRTALDPSAERFAHVRIGKVEDWDFTAANGVEIVGRVHYPPDFDPSKKYPCIVYYYGGTMPVIRSFGGRYPKNLWASHGYIVYVLQPSGATGFGQEFSAAHVNDWGKTTSAEIIEGVGKFLKAHPFVDPDRVGCIGASYGGFMTQYLLTKTDIFAAAVSHAGISAMTSYWGEGYWGYQYSADATANSFPWNRPDIYVGHSPIYSADKINTPLLLLHGTGDTNVPPGESEQMYMALKLLGKEVEYIRILGENHWILDYKKRITWSNAIISWFDKWLKGEPEWWDDMYPPLESEAEGKGESAKKGGALDKGAAEERTRGKRGETGGAVGAGGSAEQSGEAEPMRIKLPFEMPARPVQLEKYGTVLLGEVTREDIARYLPDWNAEYFDYEPDPGLKADLAKNLKDVEIVCVMGTWCSDSRREVPRLWRILEESGYPISKMKMYAVGSSRFTADMPIPKDALNWSGVTRKFYGVEAVATIIFKRGGVELGRIVEAPEASLEEDILRIVRR